MTEEESALWAVFWTTRANVDRNALVERYRGIAYSAAIWGTRKFGIEKDDLAQEAQISLIRAVEVWPGAGRFEPYACAACGTACKVMARRARTLGRKPPGGMRQYDDESVSKCSDVVNEASVAEFATVAKRLVTDNQWASLMERYSTSLWRSVDGTGSPKRTKDAANRGMATLQTFIESLHGFDSVLCDLRRSDR